MIHSTPEIMLLVQPSPIPLEEFRAEFLAMYDAGPKPTRDKLRQVLDILGRLGVETTGQFVPELVARFLADRPPGQSPYTARGLLMQLRTIFSYAEARRYVMISPFRIRRLSRWVKVGPPTGKRHLSREEVRRILGLMRRDIDAKRGWARWRARRLYALTSTIAYTGMRAREAQLLHVADVDLPGNIINLVARTRSGHLKTEAAAQPLIVPAALAPIVADWASHRLDHPTGWECPPPASVPWLFPGAMRIGPWTEGGPGSKPIDRLQAVARRAGVDGATFQALRRTWATVAEALGIPQAMITRQVRHTSEDTTKRWYQQMDLDNLGDAVSGFDF